MEPVYRESVTLSDFHLDCFQRLKPSAMLLFIQNMAEHHASRLGAGWHALAERNLFWALIRHKIKVTRLPEAGETITLETWPMPTTRVAYPRATIAYDAQGNELFRSVALWVLMDVNTRAMVLPGKSGVPVEGVVRGTELSLPGSILPKELENTLCRTVGYTDLDRNGHMNNTHYMQWVDNLLPSGFHKEHPLKEITLCYLSEAREGQELHLSWQLSQEQNLCVEAFRADTADTGKRHRIFAASVQY